MGGVKWDYIEDLTLQTWCDQENCDQLAKRLGRSVYSVKSRLRGLGIKKKNVYPNQRWTKDMEDFLRSRAGEQSSKSIAKKLKQEVSRASRELYGINSSNCTREEKDTIRPFLVAHGEIKRKLSNGTHWTSLLNKELSF